MVAPVINRGSGLPAVGEEAFSLVGRFDENDPDNNAPVRVIQGERPNVSDPGNRLVGILDLPLSENGEPGYPTVKVKFNLDASEILTVTVIDLTVMREFTTVFSDTANLTQAELDNLVTIAQENAPEDRAKAAIQSAVVGANYLYTEVEDKYLDKREKSDINPLIFSKITMRISIIDGALSQEITKIASGQQQAWRDKCSQTIVLISNAKRELKKRQNLV